MIWVAKSNNETKLGYKEITYLLLSDLAVQWFAHKHSANMH